MQKLFTLFQKLNFYRNYKKWKYKKKNDKILKQDKQNREPKNKFPLSGKVNYDFNYNPKIGIIIHYFTSLQTLKKTIDNLRHIGDEAEIIVINDRTQDFDEINSKLIHSNDRMVATKDLGESRGYIYGAKLSNASDYLIFTQDDDLCPENRKWLDDCLNEFNKDKELGMIGLCGGGINHAQKNEIDFGYEKINKKNEKYLTKEKFYCSWLKTGPLIIRKKLFESIGGWSEYGHIGETAGYTDSDLSMRCWLNNSKSMLLLTESTQEWKRRFDRGDGLTKSDLTKQTNRNLSFQKNKEKFLAKFENHFDFIEKKVKEENKKINIYP